MLNAEQRAQALEWYAQGTANLQTIAQHFGLTSDQLARELSATWKVEGLEGDEWMTGTESQCREYCAQYGYLYTAYVCPSQRRLVVHGMRDNA